MSCKELDLGDFSFQENSCCRKEFSGLYNRCYVSKEDLAEMLASGEAELVGNSKGEVQVVIYKENYGHLSYEEYLNQKREQSKLKTK